MNLNIGFETLRDEVSIHIWFAVTPSVYPLATNLKGKVHVWYLLKTNINLKTDLVKSIGEMLIV